MCVIFPFSGNGVSSVPENIIPESKEIVNQTLLEEKNSSGG